MGKRFIAVALVVGSACTALHYSSTSQSSVVVSNNPHVFNGSGSALFVVSSETFGDDDTIVSITSQCSSQWKVNTNIDPQPLPGARVCSGSGSGSTTTLLPMLVACPATYSFSVEFFDTQPGTSSCAVHINTMSNLGSASDTETLVLTGYGSGSSGIAVTPPTIEFKDVQINTTDSSETVTVKNNGSAFETVTGVLSGSGFAVSPSLGSSYSIGPGSNASFQVTCQPTAVGPLSGSLTFSGNVNSGTTMLSCNGINSDVTITPRPIAFDDTLVGRPPPKKTVRIAGNSSATIEMVALDSAAQTAGVTIDSSPQGMLVGSGQDVVLGYSAAAMHAGGSLGTLMVKVSTDAMAQNVGISGQALLGGLGTNPADVDLGAVCVSSTVMENIEVYASEAGDVVLQQLTPPAAPFAAEAVDTLPKSLSGNHAGPSATVRVSLAPTAAGEFRDAVALTSDVPNTPTTEVQLRGIGLAGGISATPNVVHFGTAMMGTTTSIQEVQLTNCGTSDLSFESAQITGMSASEFTLIGANPPRTLAPTESEVFMVVMQPVSPGVKVAQLVLQHSAGTTTADLDGTGDGEVDTKDRETYYACSTGRGTAAWPIMLALLVATARRRSRRRAS